MKTGYIFKEVIHLSFLSILLFIPLESASQVTKSENGLRAGDGVVKEHVLFIEVDESGKEAVLDLTNLVRVEEKYFVEYRRPSLWKDSVYIMGCDTFLKKQTDITTLLVANEHYTDYYYRMENEQLFLLGFQNPVTLMHYTHPMLMLDYSLSPGSEAKDVYETEGWYSGGLSAHHQGQVVVSSYPWGRIILPTADTLQHVTLVKRVQEVISQESTRLYQDTVSRVQEIETLQWYVKGYRYPIFETIRGVKHQAGEKEELFATAFYYPPSEHTYLEEDMVNLMIQDSFEKKENSLFPEDINLPGDWQVSAPGWGYRYGPNPVKGELRVDYMLEKDMGITLSVYTMAGALLHTVSYSMQPSGHYTERLDFNSYAKGQYLLTIRFDKENSSRIIIKN